MCFPIDLVRLLPRPSALQFDLQCHAQERADQNNKTENQDALKRRCNGHGPDDVGRHKELKSKQDASPQILAEPPVRVAGPSADRHESYRGRKNAKDNYENTDSVYKQADIFHDSMERRHSTPID